MIDKKFVEEMHAKYSATTSGNWYCKTRHGLGMANASILTDKPTAMGGNLIGSFGEFGEANAEFIAFCHENMWRILEQIEECRLILQWHKRGIIEPLRALMTKRDDIPDGWIEDDRIPEVDGFVAIRKVEK